MHKKESQAIGVFFTILESGQAKAPRKMFVKLTPEVGLGQTISCFCCICFAVPVVFKHELLRTS